MTTEQTTILKNLKAEDLITMALTVPGKISGCYSLFHAYSVNNAWMLSLQQAEMGLDITPVMCGSAWVKNGYITEETRKRLSKKLWALVPQQWTMQKKDKNGEVELDENGKPKTISGTSFKFRNAFLSYSMIKPYLIKEYKPDYKINIDKTLEILGLSKIKYSSVDGNCQGYCYPLEKTIAINPLAEHAQKTMLHEIAHCLLHANDNEFVDARMLGRGIKEAEAECTAYICSIMLGDDKEEDLSSSRAYIQGWLRGQDLKPVNIKRITKAVDIIMKAIANHKDQYKTKVASDLKALHSIKEDDKGATK